MDDTRIEARLEELRETAKKYAEHYAERNYLEEFKKSKLAILMKQAEQTGHTSAAAQEREARANPEYKELLDGLKAATERSEYLRWELELAKMRVSLFQTQQANMRVERKIYGG